MGRALNPHVPIRGDRRGGATTTRTSYAATIGSVRGTPTTPARQVNSQQQWWLDERSWFTCEKQYPHQVKGRRQQRFAWGSRVTMTRASSQRTFDGSLIGAPSWRVGIWVERESLGGCEDQGLTMWTFGCVLFYWYREIRWDMGSERYSVNSRSHTAWFQEGWKVSGGSVGVDEFSLK